MRAIIRNMDGDKEITGNTPSELERQANEENAHCMKVFLDGGTETLVLLAGYGWVVLP